MLSPNCHHEKSTVFVNQRQCFSLSKKQYSIFMLRAAARIQSNLLCKFINSGSMYLGIYTREEKCVRRTRFFFEIRSKAWFRARRLFGKQSFSTVSSTVFVNQRQCLKKSGIRFRNFYGSLLRGKVPGDFLPDFCILDHGRHVRPHGNIVRGVRVRRKNIA